MNAKKTILTMTLCTLFGMAVGLKASNASDQPAQTKPDQLRLHSITLAQSNTRAQVASGSYITVDSTARQYVDVFIDDTYVGTIGPQGVLKCLKGPGTYTVRARSAQIEKAYAQVTVTTNQETLLHF